MPSGYVTLYSFNQDGLLYTVIRDVSNPTNITAISTANSGTIDRPADDTSVSRSCIGYDEYNYRVQSIYPFAYLIVTPNVPACGYIPPECTLSEVNFTTTNETETGANNGSINWFCTSDNSPIVYSISGQMSASNSTGFFPNLQPGEYQAQAVDAAGCVLRRFDIIILPFDDVLYTHFKYRVLTSSLDQSTNWELRLLDMKNNYLSADYPIDLKAADNIPIKIKQSNDAEDKTTAIISRSVEINIRYDGTTFTTDEFNLDTGRQWKVELYKNNVIEFVGYLLPDEAQDYYADPSYDFHLIATDGIPSLKGNSWGDGSGTGGYSPSQTPQYGLAQYLDLIRQCLNQLGYTYGNIIIASSLRYNSTFNANLWLNLGTWSDILYDSDGSPVKTYDALEFLVGSMHLSIIQWRGRFVLLNWNDMVYLNSPSTEFNRSFSEYDFSTSTITRVSGVAPKPTLQLVGYNLPIKPVNPVQTINYDKAYNIKSKIDFNLVALLYNNPDFEINPVLDALPSGFYSYGGGVPGSGLINTDSYSGDWSFRVWNYGAEQNAYIENDAPFFTVDQPRQKMDVSFSWKVPYVNAMAGDAELGYVFSFAMIFQDGTSGETYFLQIVDTQPLSLSDWATGDYGVPETPPQNRWIKTSSLERISEGRVASIKGTPTRDFTGWQSYSISSPGFPESGIGICTIQFYGVKLKAYDPSQVPTGNPNVNTFLYLNPNDVFKTDGYYLIDDLQITTSDISEGYNKQIGEIHSVYAVTGVPQANLKEINLKLLTYPVNKRVVGSIFTTSDYVSGQVQNLWDYALRSGDIPDRLPATIVKSIARNYARPMVIWEGDVIANYIDFYGLFRISSYEEKLFMPFSIELDVRNSIGHVILVEIDDSLAQQVYSYIAIYQKNARKNINN